MYQLKNEWDGVYRIADGAWIPNDMDNKDWRAYQRWLAEGNQPLPPDQE